MYVNRGRSYLVPYKRNPYSQEMKDAAMRILNRGHNNWGYDEVGKEITFFEKEFATYCGRKYAVMLNSCLNGLYLLLQLQGISKGDEVIIQSNIEPCDAAVVVQTGATPVFVDIEEETLNIDVTQIKAKITENTKAIFPITAQGHPVDSDPIMELAADHNLYVIEDCTHGCGAKYKGETIPRGDVGVFGLQGKSFWLPGGGAMVLTDDQEVQEKLLFLRSWDGRRAPLKIKDSKGNGITNALKTMSDDLDATIGRVQLKHLDEFVKQQRKNAHIYSELLEDSPVICPIEKDYAYHAFLRFVIRTERRDALEEYLLQEGVEAHVLYPTPAHLLDYYQEVCGYKPGDFPVTEKLKKTELALPEPRPRTQWELEYTANKVKEFFR